MSRSVGALVRFALGAWLQVLRNLGLVPRGWVLDHGLRGLTTVKMEALTRNKAEFRRPSCGVVLPGVTCWC